jgi:peptidoglycan/xylan/chitin deacetylase (PgdA/CDA1 family)
MKKIILSIVFVISLLSIFSTLYQPFFLVKTVQKFFPNVLFYVPTEKNIFSLTFDDGPNPPYTDRILDILDEYDAKATFFLMGSRIKEHPEYLNKIRRRGHQIGNHSMEDKATVFLKEEEFINSLEATEKLINQDPDDKIFRPASGWILPRLQKIAKGKNFKIILGSAFVSDPRNPPKWFMLKALRSMLKPGIIMVLHDGGGDRTEVIEILPELLEFSRLKNLKSVTIKDLLQGK